MRKFALKIIFTIGIFIIGGITCFARDIDISNCLEYQLNTENMTAKIKSINRKTEKDNPNDDEFLLYIPRKVQINEKTYRVIGFNDTVENQYPDMDRIRIPKTFINSPLDQEYMCLFNFIDKCPNLKSIRVSENNRYYSSDEQGLLFNKDKTKLIMCPRGKKSSFNIPNSVNTVDIYAFKNCSFIPGCFEIPSSITRIERAGHSTIDSYEPKDEKNERIRTIICLIGESGSGKSSIGDYLERYGYVYVPTYTTREKRSATEGGHIFVDDKKDSDLNLLPDGKKKLAYICYFSGNWYWLFENQLGDRSAIAPDPFAIENLKGHLKGRNFRFVTIYLKSTQESRYTRMVTRMSSSGKSKAEIEETVKKRQMLEKAVYSSFGCGCDCVLNTSIPFEETVEYLNKYLMKNQLIYSKEIKGDLLY